MAFVDNDSRLGVKRHIPNTTKPDTVESTPVKMALYSRVEHFASNHAIDKSNDERSLSEGFSSDQLRAIKVYSYAVPAAVFLIGLGVWAASQIPK